MSHDSFIRVTHRSHTCDMPHIESVIFFPHGWLATSMFVSQIWESIKQQRSQGGVGYFSNERRFSMESSFTTHLIEFFVVETKRFVDSFVNVILTRQTRGQRSNKSAESKRWALENYFPERICYMFLMSKCRGDWDLGWCTFGVQPIAFGVTFYLNLQSQSLWSLFNGTYKRDLEN